jgi:hypothetical protein
MGLCLHLREHFVGIVIQNTKLTFPRLNNVVLSNRSYTIMAHRSRNKSFYQGSNITEVRDQYGRALMGSSIGHEQKNWSPNTSPTKALIRLPEDASVNHAKIERYRKWKSEQDKQSQRPDDGVVSVIGTNNVILRREIDDLKKQMRLLEETNRGQGDRLLRMTKANGKLVTEVETNRKDLHRMASLKDGVSTLIEKHTETRNEAKTLRRQLNYATTEKVKLEEEHKRVLQDFGDLMAKAEANLQHNAHLEEQNRNLKDRNAALEGLVEELRTTAHENLRLVLEGKAEIAKSDGALMKVKKEAQALTNLTVELSTKLQTAGINFKLSEASGSTLQLEQIEMVPVEEVEEDADTVSVRSLGTEESDNTYTTEQMQVMDTDSSSVVRMLENHVNSIHDFDRRLGSFKASSGATRRKKIPVVSGEKLLSSLGATRKQPSNRSTASPNLEQDEKLRREVESLEVLLKHAEQIHESGHDDEVRLQEYRDLAKQHSGVGKFHGLELDD